MRAAAVLHLRFTARSGYPDSAPGDRAAGERVSNLAGLKVSEAPWERFEPYLLDGLDIFVGPEALIVAGLAGGAIGAISALASALPELVVTAVRERHARGDRARQGGAHDARALPDAGRAQGRVRPARRADRRDVRAPLRILDAGRAGELERAVRGLLEAARRVSATAGGRPPTRSPSASTARCGRASSRRRAAGASAAREQHGMRLGAARFVAGETLDEALDVLRAAQRAGAAREHHAARRGRRSTEASAQVVAAYESARPASPSAAARQRRAQADAPRPRCSTRSSPTRTSSGSSTSGGARQLHPHRHGGVGLRRRRRCASTGGCATTAATTSAPCSRPTSTARQATSSRCCR